MDNLPQTTAERQISKTKEEIIREAKRIEEALLYSSKGHFAASHFWSNFHLWIGVPMVLLSAIAGASALARFDGTHIIAGTISIVVAALSGVMTFLNPHERNASHLSSGNHYDALMNKVRMFWSIECWRDESEDILTKKLKDLAEQKDRLNQSSLQVPRWAYGKAKRGIDAGEGAFVADKP
jgi:hypothetical protein